MTLRARLQRVERQLGASVAEAELSRFGREGVWPTDAKARSTVRYALAFHDVARMSVPPAPPVARGVRRRHRERQDMLDRWMEEGRPYDKDALPPLELTEEESAVLTTEVREWIGRYQANGELPEDEELRRDVVDWSALLGRAAMRNK